MARPIEYTPERLEEICKAMDKYTDETEIPIVVEFAYTYNIRKSTLYDQPGLSHSLKRMTEKKEAQLERMGLTTPGSATMCIFSLKQLGWSDKLEHIGQVDSVVTTRKEKQSRIKELLDKMV